MPDHEGDRQGLTRVCERLRSMPESRLTRATSQLPEGSIAADVHQVCVWAVAAQGLRHEVPRLHPLASADQLSVVGGDFLDWVASGGDQGTALEEWRALVARLRDVA